MADDSGLIGQGIALQTRANAYSGKPITQGLQLGMQNELRRMQIEQQKQAREQKERDKRSKFYRFKPTAVSEKYADYMRQLGHDFYNESMDAYNNNDFGAVNDIYVDKYSRANAAQKYDAEETRIMSSMVPKPNFVKKIASKDWEQGLKEYDPEVADFVVVDKLPNGIAAVSYNRTPKKVNVRDQLGDYINATLGLEPKTMTGQRYKNVFGQVQTLNKEQLNALAENVAETDIDLVDNLVADEYDAVKKLKDQYVAQGFEGPIAKHKAVIDILSQKVNDIYLPKYSQRSISEGRSGAGGGTTNTLFAEGYADLNQLEGALAALGITKYDKDLNFDEGQGSLPSLTPSVRQGKITNENGNAVEMINMAFIPIKGKWYAVGEEQYKDRLGKQKRRHTAIPVTSGTVGSMAQLQKVPVDKFVEQLNNTGQNLPSPLIINLGTSSSAYTKKTNTVAPLGSEKKGAKTSGNNKKARPY